MILGSALYDLIFAPFRVIYWSYAKKGGKAVISSFATCPSTAAALGCIPEKQGEQATCYTHTHTHTPTSLFKTIQPTNRLSAAPQNGWPTCKFRYFPRPWSWMESLMTYTSPLVSQLSSASSGPFLFSSSLPHEPLQSHPRNRASWRDAHLRCVRDV